MKKLLSTLTLFLLFIGYATAQETNENLSKKADFGISLKSLSDKEKAFNGLTKGVIITKVLEGQPAEEAGLMAGDILTHINGIEIIDLAHGIQVTENTNVSEGKVPFKIIRNGVKMNVAVKFD